MPSFLPSLNELRGFAISLNPINVFSSPEPSPESATPTPTATAGPGPSTLVNSASLNSFTRPALRPALSSASHSLEDGATARRRSTVSNVVIAVPEKVDDGLAQDRPKGKRRDRPLSVISGTAESTVETRRRKKVPWDVSATSSGYQ